MFLQDFLLLGPANHDILVDENRSKNQGNNRWPVQHPSEHDQNKSQILRMPRIFVDSRNHKSLFFAISVQSKPSYHNQECSDRDTYRRIDHRNFHPKRHPKPLKTKDHFRTFDGFRSVFGNKIYGQREPIHLDEERNKKSRYHSVFSPLSLSSKR